MLIELQTASPSAHAVRRLAQLITGRVPQASPKSNSSLLSFLGKSKKRA